MGEYTTAAREIRDHLRNRTPKQQVREWILDGVRVHAFTDLCTATITPMHHIATNGRMYCKFKKVPPKYELRTTIKQAVEWEKSYQRKQTMKHLTL